MSEQNMIQKKDQNIWEYKLEIEILFKIQAVFLSSKNIQLFIPDESLERSNSKQESNIFVGCFSNLPEKIHRPS